MRIKHLFIPVIAATLALSACGGAAEPPPPPPAPTGPTQAEIDAARAERARLPEQELVLLAAAAAQGGERRWQ